LGDFSGSPDGHDRIPLNTLLWTTYGGANNSIIFEILGDFKVEACSRSNHDYCKYPVDPAWG
ncbi:MAG: hypothetical protein MK481_10245, partial [SAR324 cluster bacterium]|nr:hypothetical protein [SAR324 cluster bacterium]